MAQRAVDIRTSYFKFLSVICAVVALLSTGRASRQRPLEARVTPRSAASEPLTTVVLAGACACAMVDTEPATATASTNTQDRSSGLKAKHTISRQVYR